MKFCSKCGTQLQDGNQFCYKCGASTADVQSYTPTQQHAPVNVDAPVPLPPRKKPKTLFIILPIVLVLLIAGGAAYYFLGIAQSPALTFVKANEMFFTGAAPATGLNEIAGRMKNEDYEASTTLKISDISGVDDQTKQMLASFSVIWDMIKVKNDGGLNMSVKMGDSELAKISGILADENFYAGISQNGSVQTAAYVAVPGDKDTPALQRIVNMLSDSKTDERMEKLIIKAKDIALQCIDMKWFSLKQGSYEDIIGEDGKVNATAVSMTLDTEAVKAFIDKFAAKLEEDPTFYDELEAVIKDSMKDASENAADEVKKAFKEASASIPDGSFKVNWTAYQNSGKTQAIHVSADINTDPQSKGTLDLMLQTRKEGDTTKTMVKLNIAPDGQTPFDITAAIENEEKKDGSGFNILVNFASGGSKGSATISGDTKITKKGSNEYTGNTTIDISADIPELTQESMPKISLIMDTVYMFGDTSFKNSRYFKLDDLKDKAVKAQNIQELFNTLFSGVQGMAGGFSGLIPAAG